MAHNYPVALSSGIIPSFAVLHTEKLEIEPAEGDRAMMYFSDNFFFCLVCQSLENYTLSKKIYIYIIYINYWSSGEHLGPQFLNGDAELNEHRKMIKAGLIIHTFN